MIITGTLITFVVGGGVFIFWPDLKKKVGSPKEKKRERTRANYIQEVYDKQFPQEELFIEAVQLYQDGPAKSLVDARGKITDRGRLLKDFMINPDDNEYNCPVCTRRVVLRHGEVSIGCTCSTDKIKSMCRELKYPIW